MKNSAIVLSVILAIVLLFSSFPIAIIAIAEGIVVPCYDNSILITVNSLIPRNFSLSDFPELPGADHMTVFEKDKTEEGYTYKMIVVDETQSVESSMEAVKTNLLVSEVSRNIYAQDYNDKASTITLSATELEIPVGTTATVSIVDADIKEEMYKVVGIEVAVNPEVITYEQMKLWVEDFGKQENGKLGVLAMYADDSNYILKQNQRLLYQHFAAESLEFLDGKDLPRKDTESPIHRYMVVKTVSSKIQYEDIIQYFVQREGMEDVCLVYNWALGGKVTSEEWRVEKHDIASIDPITDNPYGVGAVVTVTGKEPGKTVITVKRGGAGSATATCIVTVVERELSSFETPSDVTNTNVTLGDVNGDTKVNAEDALEVLKYSVQKIEFTTSQQAAAEVDGREDVNAKDALEILKYSVKKIEKFPIEDISVTSTETF